MNLNGTKHTTGSESGLLGWGEHILSGCPAQYLLHNKYTGPWKI